MTKNIIILPDQLFYRELKKYDDIVLYNHKSFYKDVSPLKVEFHKRTINAFIKSIKKPVKIIASIQELTSVYYQCFEPDNHNIRKELQLHKTIKFIDKSPKFLLSKNEILGMKNIKRHSSFYKYMKKKLDLSKELDENTDKQNRSYYDGDTTRNPNKKYWFKVSRNEVLRYLNHFIKQVLPKFGKYQDSINENNWFGFHSILSPYLNVGIITPMDVIKRVRKNKESIPYNSYEGFLRQIIGWREYARLHYYRNYRNFMNIKLPGKNCRNPGGL